MSNWHNIFCVSGSGLPRSEIVEAAWEVWYGDGDLHFSPAEGAEELESRYWQEMVIEIPAVGRPVKLALTSADDEVRSLVEETLDELGEGSPRVIQRIEGARQVLGIEFDPGQFEDDSWEMLDRLQSFIAKRLEGTLVTSDGVYDQDLQLLLET